MPFQASGVNQVSRSHRITKPMDKKSLSEQDIRTKFITPAIVEKAGWDVQTQLCEEVGLTKGRVIVRGKLVSRGWCC